MPEVRRNPGSGTFIMPVWRRVPGRYERLIALLLATVPIISLFFLTVAIGDVGRAAFLAANRGPEARDGSVPAAAQAPGSPGKLVLAALTSKTPDAAVPPSGQTGSAPPSSVVAERFAAGRQSMGAGLSGAATELRVGLVAMTWEAWSEMGVLLALGIVFCFFGWPLRRAGTALLSAAVGGLVCFGAAKSSGMSTTGAVIVSLPPAFVGALLGWHLLVLYTTCLSGVVLGSAATVLIGFFCGTPAWMPLPVMRVLLCSVAIALVYLLALRPAMISAWAAFGAGVLAYAMILGVGCLRPDWPLWEVYVLAFVVLVVLGILTQYHFAYRLAQEPPEPMARPRFGPEDAEAARA